MRCANEIREYVEGNKYLTDQELRKLLSRETANKSRNLALN